MQGWIHEHVHDLFDRGVRVDRQEEGSDALHECQWWAACTQEGSGSSPQSGPVVWRMDGEHHQGLDEYLYATGRRGEYEWICCDCAIQVSRNQPLRAISKRVLRIRNPNDCL